ncbi:MAG: response regulator [Candidatus Delongbacteria bacterium]|nr:response regulator [Candidatus Delongbacteria bacterium]MCG2759780.1 response regulator [Candidatus Delongbacteria bacterium]
MKDLIKVFIIDDDLNIINSFKRTIKSKYEDQIFWACDIISAFLRIKEFEPDLLITDVNFSKTEESSNNEKYHEELTIGGVSLARELRKLYPNLKIIASSGFRNNDMIFQKIIEKDWYDYFHTKGSGDLYEKYDEFRELIIASKSGLIRHLSKFFSPLNFGGDVHKSIFRIIHTNYERSEILSDLPDIIEQFNKFKPLLKPENASFLESRFDIYRKRDLTFEERKEIKSRFTLNLNTLKGLEELQRKTIFAEVNFITDIWNKIISETLAYSPDFECSINETPNTLELTVCRSNGFDFDKFLSIGRTISFYKQIINYGDIVISSGNMSLSTVSERFTEIPDMDGTEIKIVLKNILPV